MGDEDYWDQSENKGFLFDDKNVTTASSLLETSKISSTNRILSSAASSFSNFSEPVPGTKSIEALISKHSLSLILGEAKPSARTFADESSILRKQVEGQWIAPPPSLTVKCILLGRPYSLSLYKSFQAKSDLLDEALKTRDGNAILCVVLFLNKTLKKTLFTRLLQLKPAALPVYINYLTTRLEANDLRDLFLGLGQFRNAAFKEFQFYIKPQQNLDKRAQHLKNLHRDHFSSLESEDKTLVENFIKFVDWQVSCNLRNSPMSTVSKALSYLCLNHWQDVRESQLSPFYLSSLLNINERLFQWRAISALSSIQKWDDLSALVLTKGWIASKKLKSVISAEKIVAELYNNKAPESVLKEYFSFVDSAEKQLEIARKLKWHVGVIDTYVAMKDRQGLVQYKATLSPQDDVYNYAEKSLRLSIKWIN